MSKAYFVTNADGSGGFTSVKACGELLLLCVRCLAVYRVGMCTDLVNPGFLTHCSLVFQSKWPLTHTATHTLPAYPIFLVPFTLPNNPTSLLLRFYTNPPSAVNQAGYGYNGRISQKCDQGTYNSADTYGICEKCPYGMTTLEPGAGVTINDCGIAAGFGNVGGVIKPCPIGKSTEFKGVGG